MNKPLRAFTVKVPTKTYLRKFLNKLYGTPTPLTYWNPIGTFVLSLLGKDTFDINMNAAKTKTRLANYNDEIEFIGGFKTMGYKGHSINPDKIIAINRFLEDLFAGLLYQYCLLKKSERKWRPGYDNAIEDFAKLCGIEIDVDISMDALKKVEYRYRKRQEGILQTFVLHKKPAGISALLTRN